ncbi:MAG: hypothetical protein QOD57_1184 [Actinomycetota bacterium]|jgi:hypothetical protein|nr:hypothetical protein [Actinomycetota bacterium]MDQ1497108.1 hypothetical protein [Actinomycetota bacterium]MDQ1503457.1 hypothetical protein [Actinomycetota bacterium]
MRRVLLALIATAGLTATMALPASAAVGAGPGHGGPGAVAPHPGQGPGPEAPHPGGPGSFEPGRPGGGPGGHDHDPRYGGGPYYGGPYYGGPYYGGPYSSSCPGYYDGDGRYWSWDPNSQTFQPCPDGVVCCS